MPKRQQQQLQRSTQHTERINENYKKKTEKGITVDLYCFICSLWFGNRKVYIRRPFKKVEEVRECELAQKVGHINYILLFSNRVCASVSVLVFFSSLFFFISFAFSWFAAPANGFWGPTFWTRPCVCSGTNFGRFRVLLCIHHWALMWSLCSFGWRCCFTAMLLDFVAVDPGLPIVFHFLCVNSRSQEAKRLLAFLSKSVGRTAINYSKKKLLEEYMT